MLECVEATSSLCILAKNLLQRTNFKYLHKLVLELRNPLILSYHYSDNPDNKQLQRINKFARNYHLRYGAHRFSVTYGSLLMLFSALGSLSGEISTYKNSHLFLSQRFSSSLFSTKMHHLSIVAYGAYIQWKMELSSCSKLFSHSRRRPQ